MNVKNKNKRFWLQLALLSVILVVLSFTPIGSIILPFMKATTTHIPVIIGAILLGPKAGGFLGGLFGVVSVIRSTIFPTLTTFIFSPFLPVPGTDGGNWKALFVAFVPRILIGVCTAYLYQFLCKIKISKTTNMIFCSVTGSLINTVGVLFLIYVLFGEVYTAVLKIDFQMLWYTLVMIAATNGLGEAIAAAVISPAVCQAVQKI